MFNQIQEIAQMQKRANAKEQLFILSVLNKLTNRVHAAAEESTRKWSDLSQRINNIHIRTVPKSTQRAYNMGIEATKRRNERLTLETKGMDREDAKVTLIDKNVCLCCFNFNCCIAEGNEEQTPFLFDNCFAFASICQITETRGEEGACGHPEHCETVGRGQQITGHDKKLFDENQRTTAQEA